MLAVLDLLLSTLGRVLFVFRCHMSTRVETQTGSSAVFRGQDWTVAKPKRGHVVWVSVGCQIRTIANILGEIPGSQQPPPCHIASLSVRFSSSIVVRSY